MKAKEKYIRKVYDKDEYLSKTTLLREVIANATSLAISREEHQVFGEIPQTNLMNIVYIDKGDMQLFDAIHDFDCRLIKLINYGKPAVRLHYFSKHKYYLDKNPDLDEVRSILGNQIDKLRQEIADNPDRASLESDLGYIKQLEKWFKKAPKLQFAFSNYYQFYTYWYVAYNYVSPAGIETKSTHLVKHIYDRFNNITQEKTNIIFVDPELICMPISNDNKEVTKFLAEFHRQIPLPKYTLYIKE